MVEDLYCNKMIFRIFGTYKRVSHDKKDTRICTITNGLISQLHEML